MDHNRVCCNKSRVGLLKVPGGLDRSWETRRLQGLEMLGQSLELQRERSNQKAIFQEVSTKKKTRHKKRYGAPAVPPSEIFHDFQAAESNDASKAKMHEDYTLRLEYQTQELGKQLMVERQKNRQDKLNIARLQQELARHKSERPFKEMLTKELVRERQVRLEVEQRLSRLTKECTDYKEKAASLEKDLKKMTELAQGLAPYKSRFEELQRDGMTGSFDGNTLHSDDGEKTKVLLERLRMLEAEKTSLVLENENQSQMYEKCLDEITSQVLEALMAQRNLKEECFKLQNRVLNLQQQNVQLTNIFQHHLRLNPDSPSLEQLMSDEKSKLQIQRPSFIGDLGISLNSLNSIFSDQDQMQFLMSQISSPSVEFHDCAGLTDPSAVILGLAGAFSSCPPGVAENYEGEEEKRKEGNFIRPSILSDEKQCVDDDFKRTKQTSGTDESTATLLKYNRNQAAGRNPIDLSKAMPMLASHVQPISYRAFKNQKCQENYNSCHEKDKGIYSSKKHHVNVMVNGLVNETWSSDSDCDPEMAYLHCPPNACLDTGSTVSLNELLDLAVTDVDYENGNFVPETIKSPADSSVLSYATDKPMPSELKQATIIDSKSQELLDCEALANAGHSGLVSLPDVCPDHRSTQPV